MPAVSEKQRAAMWAAASGNGKLGIPSKVAREFTESDPGGKLPAKAKDMARSQFSVLKKLLDKFFSEEEKEPEHAEDEQSSPKEGDRIVFVSDNFTDKGPAETSIIRVKDGNIGVQWDKDEFQDFPWSKLVKFAKCTEVDGKNVWTIGKQSNAEDDLVTAANGGIPTAASVMYGTPAGRVLFVKRAKTEENWPDTWSLPGGKADEGEDAASCAVRECKEEIGHDADPEALSEVESKETPYGWRHVLYAHPVDEEFEPTLNDEHSEHVWAPIDEPPEPLHPGVKASLDALRAKAKDDGEEEETVEDQANDSALLGPYTVRVERDGTWAYDAALLTTAARRARMQGRNDIARRADAICAREFRNDSFAFDRDSVRRTDDDGRLHVDSANISRANVCGYKGSEINDVMAGKPGWKDLQPDKIYNLLRDPDELAKAVSSFDNLPILDEHVPVSAKDHKPEHVIGSTGTDAKFDGDHLTNSLVFWSQDAIDDIESGNKKALSAAYKYDAKMEPGVHNGEHFDGRMINLVGNHLAQVFKGRSGPTVVVGDSSIDFKEKTVSKKTKLSPMVLMATGALDTYLRPRLAQDTELKVLPFLLGVTSKNFASKIPSIVSGLKVAAKGKLAQDADLEDVGEVLEAIADLKPEIAQAMEAGEGEMEEDDEDEDDDTMQEDDDPPEMMAKVREFLKDRLKPDDMAKFDEMVGNAPEVKEPESVEEDEKKWAMDFKKRMGRDESDEERDERMKKMAENKPVTKAAMDASIEAAIEVTNKKHVAIRDAEKAVRPYVGELSIACDSADMVYRTALDMLGVSKVKDIHPSAYPHILSMQKKKGTNGSSASVGRMAADAAGSKSFSEFLPGTANIQRM